MKEIAVAQENLLKKVTREHELHMSCGRTCSNIIWMQMDNHNTKEKKSLCSLDREHWKAQNNFEEDK